MKKSKTWDSHVRGGGQTFITLFAGVEIEGKVEVNCAYWCHYWILDGP